MNLHEHRMKCEICNLGPEEGVTIYRQNPLGEKGIWRCQQHSRAAALDPETQNLVRVIEADSAESD